MPNQINPIRIDGLVAYLHVTRRDGSTVEVMVDTADLPKLQGFGHRWSVMPTKTGSFRPKVTVEHKGRKETILLYRFLLDAQPGTLVDHINGDPLDNRRSNLRFVTPSQNLQNSAKCRSAAGYRNVVHYRSQGKYAARLMVEGKSTHIGLFDTAEEASEAARLARMRLQTHCAENSRI